MNTKCKNCGKAMNFGKFELCRNCRYKPCGYPNCDQRYDSILVNPKSKMCLEHDRKVKVAEGKIGHNLAR